MTKPGRPRSQRAQNSILDAAVDLLLTRDLPTVSMDAVATRAGVSKATIYRWWPTKETLALDALYREWSADGEAPPDTGSLRSDLEALLVPWVEEIRDRPYDVVIATLFAKARSDAEFAEQYIERLAKPRRSRARAVFTRACDRGEIRQGIDMDLAIDLLYGPLYLRLLQGHAPIAPEFARQIVNGVIDGLPKHAEANGHG